MTGPSTNVSLCFFSTQIKLNYVFSLATSTWPHRLHNCFVNSIYVLLPALTHNHRKLLISLRCCFIFALRFSFSFSKIHITCALCKCVSINEKGNKKQRNILSVTWINEYLRPFSSQFVNWMDVCGKWWHYLFCANLRFPLHFPLLKVNHSIQHIVQPVYL